MAAQAKATINGFKVLIPMLFLLSDEVDNLMRVSYRKFVYLNVKANKMKSTSCGDAAISKDHKSISNHF